MIQKKIFNLNVLWICPMARPWTRIYTMWLIRCSIVYFLSRKTFFYFNYLSHINLKSLDDTGHPHSNEPAVILFESCASHKLLLPVKVASFLWFIWGTFTREKVWWPCAIGTTRCVILAELNYVWRKFELSIATWIAFKLLKSSLSSYTAKLEFNFLRYICMKIKGIEAILTKNSLLDSSIELGQRSAQLSWMLIGQLQMVITQ